MRQRPYVKGLENQGPKERLVIDQWSPASDDPHIYNRKLEGDTKGKKEGLA